MTQRSRRVAATGVSLVALLVSALGLIGAVGVQPAGASTATVTAPVTADTLHAYGGIVYGSAQIGNRIYISGTFTQVGYNDGTRFAIAYLAAFDATTGRLDPTFRANPSGEVRTLLASADGTRLYAGGAATTYNGIAVGRLASLDPATGSPDPAFKPMPSAKVWSLAQAGPTLYLGGDFTAVSGVAMTRLASVSATTGVLDRAFNLPVNGQVRTLKASPDGARLYVAGAYTSVAGVQRYNFSSVDTASKALTAWDPEVRAHGWGIGLSPDGSVAYVTTSDGDDFVCNDDHEAIIAMQAVAVGTPQRLWRQASPTNCVYNSGDVNALAVTGDAVYVGGHLALLSDGTQYRYHLAALDPATGTPLAFNPDVKGTAGVLSLNVTSAGLLVGGDFDTAAGAANSRFALFRRGADGFGPGLPSVPRATSRVAGQILVRWSSVADPTDNTVTYSVYRDNGPVPVYHVTGAATAARSFSYTDATQPVGTSHTYRIGVSDGVTSQLGNPTSPVGVSGTNRPVPYASAVLADQPSFLWRLGETDPAQGAADASPNGSTGVYSPQSVQLREGGAIAGDPSDALYATGYNSAAGPVPSVSSSGRVTGPQTFSVETWVRTRTRSGGKILGFGDNQFGPSGNYDRHLYMINTGQLIFGTYNGTTNTVTTVRAYNDGAWHHVVATFGGTGMHMYVDGAEVAGRADVTSAHPFDGYWKVGGDSLGGWPNTAESQTSNKAFTGAIDEVAVYPAELTAAQVTAHYAARQ